MSSVEDENSNSSDSSMDEDDMEKKVIAKAEELEAQLSTNKYLYDVHVEVINLYRSLADLKSMREAYQRFHKYFPLTPKLWLEWIEDERKIANTQDEQKLILNLFAEAVEDYLSVDLWIEYAQYSIGVSDLETTRTILEKGLSSAGLHASQGSLLWDTLREVENAHVSLYQKDSEEWISQVKRVAEVFKRQLSVPLLNMENTYLEWTEWSKLLPEGLVDFKQVDWGYKKALQNLELYKPFEEQLLSTDESGLIEIYKEYIKIVKDPATTICLYERALVTLCLTPSLWEDYIKFSFKMMDVVLKVAKKALRNCPWSEELWIAMLRVLENNNKEEKDIISSFEEALSNINRPSLDIWFSFLEYYHRNSKDYSKLDKLFSKALEQIPPEYDPSCKLSRWYARVVARRGDIANARKIWNRIITEANIKGSANAWLEFINLERQYGEKNQARNIFKRAISACKDWASYIAEEWMIFERDVGSLEDVMKCSEKCKDFVTYLPQSSERKTYEQNRSSKGHKRKHESDEALDFKKLKVSQAPDVRKKEFRKKELPSTSKIIDKNPKTTVFVSNLHPKVTEQHLKNLFPNALNISIVLDKKGMSRCFGYIQFSKEEEALTALAKDRIPLDGRPVYISELKDEKKQELKYPAKTEENKLFVKGLPLTKTKEEVEEIFKSFNPVDVRLIFKKNGQSKGFAFVEFKTKEEAKKALELNSKVIDGHELMVAISSPPEKKTADKIDVNEPIRHARSRLMIPRTLQVKTNTEKSNNGGVDSLSKEKKSNADFRNMFLKK